MGLDSPVFSPRVLIKEEIPDKDMAINQKIEKLVQDWYTYRGEEDRISILRKLARTLKSKILLQPLPQKIFEIISGTLMGSDSLKVEGLKLLLKLHKIRHALEVYFDVFNLHQTLHDLLSNDNTTVVCYSLSVISNCISQHMNTNIDIETYLALLREDRDVVVATLKCLSVHIKASHSCTHAEEFKALIGVIFDLLREGDYQVSYHSIQILAEYSEKAPINDVASINWNAITNSLLEMIKSEKAHDDICLLNKVFSVYKTTGQLIRLEELKQYLEEGGIINSLCEYRESCDPIEAENVDILLYEFPH